MYKDTLAVGGVEGTISKVFKETAYKGRVIGKTGWINNVRSFTGVCQTDRGDYLFSILANGANGIMSLVNGITKAVMDEYRAK